MENIPGKEGERMKPIYYNCTNCGRSDLPLTLFHLKPRINTNGYLVFPKILLCDSCLTNPFLISNDGVPTVSALCGFPLQKNAVNYREVQ